jgi:tRNA pseudouridine13 synthase
MPIDPLLPPLLTPDVAGVGGRIKVRAEDFEVEEVPSYEPSGTGDHLYLWVQKTGVGPEFLTRMIADRLGVPVGAVATAGLKDRHAVTRQWVSVPGDVETKLAKINGGGIELLKFSRHTNKLKPGHLRGNKFIVLIRDADPSKADAATAVLDRIRAFGMPNYYGPQRFGRDGGNVDLGFRCLAGTQPKRLRPFVYKFALSAVQSVLFNHYLGERMADGLFRTVLAGDVMMKWPFGGLFVAEDVPTEQGRFDARETVTGGPMFGRRTFAAAGVAAEREARILAAHNLTPAVFDGFGKLMGGTRRHNLIYLDDLTAEWLPAGLRLTFTMPSGCYATVLLREVMKAESDGDDEPQEE